MKQLTLTNQSPIILDGTCSFKHSRTKRWPAHATIRMDIRPEVNPDVVGDIKRTDFPNHYFDEIYLDPPHMIRKDPFMLGHDIRTIRRRMGRINSDTPNSFHRYGFFKTRDEWMEFVRMTNQEVFRILKPGGKFHYKATFSKDNRYILRKDLDEYTNFVVIKEKITNSRINPQNKVHWLTMIPKETTSDRNCLT